MTAEDKNYETPNVPEDPIKDIVESLMFREENRRRAIDLAWHSFNSAETDEERHEALVSVATMMCVLKEFHAQFPEVFPPEDENQ